MFVIFLVKCRILISALFLVVNYWESKAGIIETSINENQNPAYTFPEKIFHYFKSIFLKSYSPILGGSILGILGILMFIVKNIAIDKSRKKSRTPHIVPLYRKEDDKEIINFDEYKSKKIEEIEKNDKQLEFNKVLQIMQKVL